MAYHPYITQTPAQLEAQARDYDARGLHELAKSARKQAKYVAARDKRAGRRT